jgi:hypothetical protein
MNEFATVVPSVGFAVYAATTAVAALSFVSLATIGVAVEVPAVLAVVRRSRFTRLLAFAVEMPKHSTYLTRTTAEAEPVRVKKSVALAAGASAVTLA